MFVKRSKKKETEILDSTFDYINKGCEVAENIPGTQKVRRRVKGIANPLKVLIKNKNN